MSNLMNYLPCPKCLNFPSNIIKLETKENEKENDLFLKLSCANNCSINCIKLSEIKQILINQTKIPLSIFIYGKFSQQQTQIENISSKIFNKLDSIYSSIEKLEKEIITLKEEIKIEIDKYKKSFEDFQLLHELIYGAYLKNIKDTNEDLNNNLKYLNINDYDNYHIQNNFYIKEIEKDIITIENSINYIKKELFYYLKNNPIISINEDYNNNNKSLFPLYDFSISNLCPYENENTNIIESYNTSIKDIEAIIQLSDGNIALGSFDEMIIYNLELRKEILNIPGDFSNIRELKYYKKDQTNKNDKNIIILTIQTKRLKIYDLYKKSLLLNYSQYYNIDNVLELYNGDILYICDFSIYNINLSEEFKISLKYYCFSMINFIDKPNILGYSNLSKIKLINLDKPNKIIKEIQIKDSTEIYDLKQIYEDKNNYNYLIILSKNYLILYDLNTNQFIFKSAIYKLYKNLYISKNSQNNININLIGENSFQLFIIKNNQFIHIHTIDSLKKKIASLYNKISTPFSINNKGKYLLVFDNNDEGFNSL